MTTPDQQETPPGSLLDDAEFATLMDAEYRAGNQPVDDIVKERLWQRIRKRQTSTRRRWQKWAPLAAAAALVLIVAPVLLHQETEMPAQRAKGNAAGDIVVLLEAFIVDAEGQLHSYQQAVPPGTTLVFKTKASRPGYLALAMARPDTAPAVRFSTRVRRPGIAELLERDGRSYGYQFEASDRDLRFCVVGTQTEQDLQARTETLQDDWQYLIGHACVVVGVAGD